MSDARPTTVTVVVPCFDEAGFVDQLLDQLLPAIEGAPHWSLVLVDDSSTDATPSILAAAAARSDRVTVLTGRWGSPGGARSAGVALALRLGTPGWLLTLDADVTLAEHWREQWDASFADAALDPAVGAINGVELQDHLFGDHPNAARVGDAFGAAVGASEAAVGITNLNGVNHAISTAAYLTAGPYLQPTAPGPHGVETLAGEDWDLGVRIRRAGFSIAETNAAVLDRGRRLLSDVHAYVSGDAYEGAFGRPSPADDSAGGSPDLAAVDVPVLADGAVDRVLRHFLCKPILAGAVPLDEVRGLSAATLADMDAWMHRWPHPTFDESRNGFVFGRLARFADEFVPRLRTELGLEHVLGPH